MPELRLDPPLPIAPAVPQTAFSTPPGKRPASRGKLPLAGVPPMQPGLSLPPPPPVPGFTQMLRLVEADRTIGWARWHIADASQGVMQILELEVDTTLRRQGYGRRLMDAAIAQGRQYLANHQLPLRRVWLAVQQKRQIIARSFLTKCGFHHTGSVEDLLAGQEALVYVKGTD